MFKLVILVSSVGLFCVVVYLLCCCVVICLLVCWLLGGLVTTLLLRCLSVCLGDVDVVGLRFGVRIWDVFVDGWFWLRNSVVGIVLFFGDEICLFVVLVWYWLCFVIVLLVTVLFGYGVVFGFGVLGLCCLWVWMFVWLCVIIVVFMLRLLLLIVLTWTCWFANSVVSLLLCLFDMLCSRLTVFALICVFRSFCFEFDCWLLGDGLVFSCYNWCSDCLFIYFCMFGCIDCLFCILFGWYLYLFVIDLRVLCWYGWFVCLLLRYWCWSIVLFLGWLFNCYNSVVIFILFLFWFICNWLCLVWYLDLGGWT